jgi:RTX calcium-binding nonapeptide repeat (4 copies)
MASTTCARSGRGRPRVRSLALWTSSVVFALTAAAFVPPASAGVDADAATDPPALDTTATLPALGTTDVTVLGPSTARLSASLDPNSLVSSVYFEYGENGVFNLSTPKIVVGAGVSPTDVAADLLDLKPGSSYSVRLMAVTPDGSTVAGPPAEFTTPPSSDRPRYVNLSGVRMKCTIVGTARRDKLNGTRKRDVICGLGGNDRINGRGGSDVIVGGSGNDRIVGGSGADQIYGNGGRDRLVGNKGRDRLFGGGGRDRLITSGDRRRGDRLNGGSGRDSASTNRGDRTRSIERLRRR